MAQVRDRGGPELLRFNHPYCELSPPTSGVLHAACRCASQRIPWALMALSSLPTKLMKMITAKAGDSLKYSRVKCLAMLSLMSQQSA